MKNPMRLVLLVSGWIAFLTVACARTNDVTTLSPVVVCASRIDSRADELPANVQILNNAQIEHSGARDLTELLDKQANVQIRTINANPMQAQIALRGFGENAFGRVKILVDGEELNAVDMEAPNLARIPLGSIERIEIIPGPSPVLHGDGAVAGVIHIATDTHDYTRRTKITARGGSYGTFGANIQTRGGFADEGLFYSAAYDYGRSDGFRERTGYDTHTFDASVRKNFENGSTVGLKTHYFNARHEMPGALTFDQWKADRRQALKGSDSCQLWQYGVALDAKMRLAEDQWLYFDGAFSVKHRTARWGQSSYADAYANDYDLYAYQASPRYVNEKDVFGFENKVSIGYDFKYDRYDVCDNMGGTRTKPRFDRARHALFLHEEFFLTETLSLVAGARGEYIDNQWDAQHAQRETHSQNVLGDFELGLVYRPVEELKTYLKGTRFHRSAFCDELNYTEDGSFLDPETGTSLDLGLAYAFHPEWTLNLAGYWNVMEDEIFYNPHAKDAGYGYWYGYNCNSPGRTERLGFDTDIRWLRDKTAEATIRYAFVQARFADGQYEGETVPLVPQSRVRAEVGIWLLNDLEVKGGYRYVTKQVLAGDFDNAHTPLSGYSIFDLGAYYTPAWAAGWKASLVLDNLLDRNYCDFAGWSDYTGGYYYPACGRSFMLTLSYAF